MKKQKIEFRIRSYTDHFERLKELIEDGFWIDSQSYHTSRDLSIIIYHKI